MTYLEFHLFFTLPLVAVLGLVSWLEARRARPLGGSLGRRTPFAFWALILHVVIAFTYTTPWDNYLVAQQVWGYGESRVLATVGYVPVEEYLFFILQTIITGLFLFLLARHFDGGRQELSPDTRVRIRVFGATFWLLIAAAGVLALTVPKGTYFGLIAVWATPVIALQWGFGGDLLVRRWRLLLPALSVPTLYLWAVDRFAIHSGIWWISEGLSSGLAPLGLPVEEAFFFLVTNLLVVFGLTLALEPASLARLDALRGVRWWRGALALWALSMIPTPLFPAAFAPLAYISTALLALGIFGYALERYGTRAWLLFGAAFSFGLLVEWLGHTTGVPFGAYSYSAPGPSLLGVPLLVPLGWFAFTLIALAVSPVYKLWVAPLALVAWDLGLDPLMVDKGFWTFQANTPYYDIPLTNFLGWYAAGVVLVWLLLRLEPRLKGESSRDLRLIFIAQAFLMATGLLFFGLVLAALVTLVAMGAFIVSWRLRPVFSSVQQIE